jgi:hypothetical protein
MAACGFYRMAATAQNLIRWSFPEITGCRVGPLGFEPWTNPDHVGAALKI